MIENNSKLAHKFKPLFTALQIRNKIKTLATQLNKDNKNDANTIFVGILNGAVFFLTDLMIQLNFTAELDFIQASSYGSEIETSGNVTLSNLSQLDLNNKHVIVVDDIIDTGLTLLKIKTTIQEKFTPKSVKTCVLLKKYGRERVHVDIDYYCFEIDNKFVVGYGLDINNQYRNLDGIYYLDNHD